jgi:signal transduction histidine kinase
VPVVCSRGDWASLLGGSPGSALRQMPGRHPTAYPRAVNRALRRAAGNPRLVDATIAFGLAIVGAIEVLIVPEIAPKPVALVCEIGAGLALLPRRRFPMATLLVVGLFNTISALAGVPINAPFVPFAALLISICTLATLATTERAVIGYLAVLGLFVVMVVSQDQGVGNFLFGFTFVTPIWLGGRALRARTMRAEDAERAEGERAREAVEEERRRIARELHDVISHSLAVLVLQAGAAEQVLDRDPSRARELLEAIRTTGQEAVGEMRIMLGLIRGDAPAPLGPQPRLGDLDALIERMEAAGLAVRLSVEGTRRDLSAALELSAYRIVQEGLTNALRHAGEATARVVLRYEERSLEVVVSDDGRGRMGPTGARSGLVGLAERVSLLGGRFDAGPRPEGGWTLRAVLPATR